MSTVRFRIATFGPTSATAFRTVSASMLKVQSGTQTFPTSAAFVSAKVARSCRLSIWTVAVLHACLAALTTRRCSSSQQNGAAWTGSPRLQERVPDRCCHSMRLHRASDGPRPQEDRDTPSRTRRKSHPQFRESAYSDNFRGRRDTASNPSESGTTSAGKGVRQVHLSLALAAASAEPLPTSETACFTRCEVFCPACDSQDVRRESVPAALRSVQAEH